MLPRDDAQARYFGLITLALSEIGGWQDIGLLLMPEGERIIDEDVVDAIARECRKRGIYYTDAEVVGKGRELIRQWAGFYDVLPEAANG